MQSSQRRGWERGRKVGAAAEEHGRETEAGLWVSAGHPGLWAEVSLRVQPEVVTTRTADRPVSPAGLPESCPEKLVLRGLPSEVRGPTSILSHPLLCPPERLRGQAAEGC